ncbi:MAG: hypothetical protein GX061_00385 [Eubacteriaceae bacterium]|nr:hypothetical protein [Eubacteriaceae bacterium]
MKKSTAAKIILAVLALLCFAYVFYLNYSLRNIPHDDVGALAHLEAGMTSLAVGGAGAVLLLIDLVWVILGKVRGR